jgi:chromosome segregation ATPase
MTLIRKSLYKELIEGRNERLAVLEAKTDKLKAIVASIAEEQSFVDGFTKTQETLAASKAALEAKVVSGNEALKKLEEAAPALQEAIATAKSEVSEAKENLKKQQEVLEKLKEEGASASDQAAQQIVIDSAEAVVSSKETNEVEAKASLAVNEKSQETEKTAISVAKTSVEETNKQIEDNNEKKKNSTDKIAELTANKDKTTDEKADAQKAYDDFLAENKDTINSYESQQLRRDQNISKDNPNIVFFRQPTDNAVISEANTVMDGVIADELATADEAEKEELKKWVASGTGATINPSYLSATQAKDLTLSAIWSTRKVAKQIKDACMAGEFKTECGSLNNSIIYALQKAGFRLYLTESTNDKAASIVINWENITDPAA